MDQNRYEIIDGRIATRSLEAHVVDHCNLRCRQCCSLSPFHAPWTVEPEALAEDLRRARRVLRPRFLKLVGGEPLLHPRLGDCLEVARDADVAPVVSLTTNGILLKRMPERCWRLLDHLTLSLYPRPRLTQDELDRIRRDADRFGVELNLKRQDRFEQIHESRARDDERRTSTIFGRCWLRRRCHMLREGWFYTCTVPVHFDRFWSSDPPFARLDGLYLHDGPELVHELEAYLERRRPLEACRRCLGGTGPLLAHRQLTRAEIEARDAGPM